MVLPMNEAHRPARIAEPESTQGNFLLTVDEVAEVLRTSRKAIYAMAERKLLPGVVRIGRRLLVRRDDLIDWLRESRASSAAESKR